MLKKNWAVDETCGWSECSNDHACKQIRTQITAPVNGGQNCDPVVGSEKQCTGTDISCSNDLFFFTVLILISS